METTMTADAIKKLETFGHVHVSGRRYFVLGEGWELSIVDFKGEAGIFETRIDGIAERHKTFASAVRAIKEVR
jgi:hypothetical protein